MVYSYILQMDQYIRGEHMDQDRRKFFRNLGAKTASVAVGAAIPAAYHTQKLALELKELAKDLNSKLSETTAQLGSQIGALSDRLDANALTMTYQQAQITLIFLLLLISFAIDGGMTLYWLI